MSKRKNHSPEFEAKVVLEALEGERLVVDLPSHFGAHPTMIHSWKRAFQRSFDTLDPHPYRTPLCAVGRDQNRSYSFALVLKQAHPDRRLRALANHWLERVTERDFHYRLIADHSAGSGHPKVLILDVDFGLPRPIFLNTTRQGNVSVTLAETCQLVSFVTLSA